MTKILAKSVFDLLVIGAFVFVVLVICGTFSARSAPKDCHQHNGHIHCH